MDIFKNYLLDLGDLIREQGMEAKRQRDREKSDFAQGKLLAYHEVVSLMQSQAKAFGIDISELKLDTIDPHKDLL